MPRLSLGLGVQAVSKVKSGGAAPTEISVATTNTIIVTGTPTWSGTYTKENGQYVSGGNSLSFSFGLGPQQWFFYDGDQNQENGFPLPALNANFIPCAFSTAPITLTAA